jgi:hypothetical protein
MAAINLYEAVQTLINSLGLVKGGPPLATAAQVLIDGNGNAIVSQDASGNPSLSGFSTRSSVDALTALAGGGQAGATPITASIARFTVVATGGDSSLLPAAIAGRQVTVINSGAASMNVFPATGETIDAGAANAASAVANAKSAIFSCAIAGKWHKTLSA